MLYLHHEQFHNLKNLLSGLRGDLEIKIIVIISITVSKHYEMDITTSKTLSTMNLFIFLIYLILNLEMLSYYVTSLLVHSVVEKKQRCKHF